MSLKRFVPTAMFPALRAARAIATLKGPRVVVEAKRRWMARKPVTFSQKLARKLLEDRRSLLTVFADKATAGGYVRERLGTDIGPKRHAVARTPEAIDWSSLPRNFVTKVNHGSGGAVIVWEQAPRGNLLPRDPGRIGWATFLIHPDDLDLSRLTALLRRWTGLNYGSSFETNYEWAYRNIAPRILVEELLVDGRGRLPADYRCFVFNGVCRMVQVDSDRNSDAVANAGQVLHRGTRRDFFDREWRHIAMTSNFPNAEIAPPRPEQLERMLELAEKLASETDFVRVDFYAVPGRLVFGELTNYPTSGTARFEPPSFDKVVGDWWTMPASYAELPDRPYIPVG